MIKMALVLYWLSDGRLGYPSVDTQATPRKVGTLKVRVSIVAAANKHSAVLTQCGDVYTWGCNSEGQLGYGTSNSASNCMPRWIDYLKGRKLVTISTAKYHTVVLEESKREDGEFEHKVNFARGLIVVSKQCRILN